ncbi:MAG: YitT family protein [Candidatus Krumholzibacteria bacterium]|nr:YitT family protein [Candidatus Krumholzibacteria bacterium]
MTRPSTKTLLEYLFITAGALIMSLGVAAFLVDARVVPGGVTGLSMAIHYLSGNTIPVGILMRVLNLPLFVWGIVELGRSFGFRTFWGFTVNAFFVDFLRGEIVPSIRLQDASAVHWLRQHDFFFLVLIGAIFLGVGLGIIFKFKGTTAGSDIVAAIARKRFRWKPGMTIIVTDFFVICVAGLAIHLRGLSPDMPVIVLMLYAFMLLIVSSQLIDVIIFGFDYAKSAYIISDRHDEIAGEIIHTLGRGATAIRGKGLYRGVERDIIFTVVSRREIYSLVDTVRRIDPDAFMIINRVHEVLGEGFMPRGEVDFGELKRRGERGRPGDGPGADADGTP